MEQSRARTRGTAEQHRPSAVVIRTAERRDAEGIRTIYNHYVTESTTLFDMVPRTLDEQVQWIDEHSGGHPAVVAELDGHQGRGVGRLLLEEVLRLASAHGFHSVIARITGDNQASIALHAACGFEIVGTEREVGRKFGQWLDVVEMQRML